MLFSAMALLEIKKYPEPILRRKAEEIKEISEDIKRLAKDMVETLEKNNGAGLAAPQVGQSVSLIVGLTEKDSVVFINPKITKKSKETETTEEGCLSFPGIWLKIKRAKWVEIEAIVLPNFDSRNPEALDPHTKRGQGALGAKNNEVSPRYGVGVDINNKKVQIKAEGIFARILQHEIDHLDGILFIDKISFFRKLKKRFKAL